MNASDLLTLLFTHPLEFRSLIQYKLFHEPRRDVKVTGWERPSMRRCWHFLDFAGRSFAAVIKELEGDLARTVCLFYLVLRALDTVEDDETLDPELKQTMLRSFDQYTVTPGWTFKGSGPNEKDRIVLVEYDQIIHEVGLLPSEHRAIILDICQKMQTGMADYALQASSMSLPTVASYDIYCHYVAGLVGQGLSRIFAASRLEASWLAQQMELSNSMGLLLQKTNIIRDFREDCAEKRFFWPREIWEKFGFEDARELCRMDDDTRRRAQHVQSAMVLDALGSVTDSLDYLKLLRNKSVFKFCAIPATMAIATLELCFMNPQIFQEGKRVKIRKGVAAKLIIRSTSPRDVAYIFRDYARRIHAKASPDDPSFPAIGVMCAKIEQWYERHYPSYSAWDEDEPLMKGTLPESESDELNQRHTPGDMWRPFSLMIATALFLTILVMWGNGAHQ